MLVRKAKLERLYMRVSHVGILSQADWVTTNSSTLVHKLEKAATTPRVVCGYKDYVSASSEDINVTCEQCREWIRNESKIKS